MTDNTEHQATETHPTETRRYKFEQIKAKEMARGASEDEATQIAAATVDKVLAQESGGQWSGSIARVTTPPQQAPYPVSHAVWTVPNVISFARIILIVVFGVLFIGEQDLAAIIVLFCAGASDFLDGFLARRWHQVTALGRLLDPAADRLLTLVVVLGLAIRDIIPWWLVIILMARDAMVGLALLYGRANRVRSPHVTFVGKAATFCLYITLPLAYVGYELATWLQVTAIVLSCGAAVLYWISGVGYVKDIRHRVAAARRAAHRSAAGPRMETQIRDSEEAS